MGVQHLSGAIFASALLAASAVACGSRGPLDLTVIEVAPDAEADASPTDGSIDAIEPVDAADAAADGAADAPTDGMTGPDAQDAAQADGGRPGFDAGPILSCGTCVAESCGSQLLTCIESTSCRSALECVATTCLQGGTPNITCVLGCANGDTGSLTQIVGAFTCIVETCGSQCTSVLSGLGGLGGVGGGSGG